MFRLEWGGFVSPESMYPYEKIKMQIPCYTGTRGSQALSALKVYDAV